MNPLFFIRLSLRSCYNTIFSIMFLCVFFGSACAKDTFVDVRKQMIQEQLISRGIRDQKVLNAMRKVPRHLFVPLEYQQAAYTDGPLPIGYDQTISQPYIVALMTELLTLQGHERILEIGAGSGYQAAILAEIAKEVYTIELVEPLARQAKQRLHDMGYTNIFVKQGDGFKGWREHAPYDGIIATCAPTDIPQTLIDQLKDDGRMVIPVGDVYQELKVITKKGKKIITENILPVRFVPMVHEEQITAPKT